MTTQHADLHRLRWSSPAVVLASMIIVGFFAALFTMLLYTKDGTDIMVGALIAAVSTVTGFFFGSSSSSAGKDAAIAELTKTAATVATTAQATQVAADVAAGTLKTGEVKIDADTVTVDGKPT